MSYLPKVAGIAYGEPAAHVDTWHPLATEVLSAIEDHLRAAWRRASSAVRAVRPAARPRPFRPVPVLITR